MAFMLFQKIYYYHIFFDAYKDIKIVYTKMISTRKFVFRWIQSFTSFVFYQSIIIRSFVMLICIMNIVNL